MSYPFRIVSECIHIQVFVEKYQIDFQPRLENNPYRSLYLNILIVLRHNIEGDES